MTLKHLLTTLTLATSMLLGFNACNDEDYAPITLKVLEGTERVENNQLQLDAFSPGESFAIVGGNGQYVIENLNEDIIDFKYDGHAIKFIPVGIGTATVNIYDHVGNRMVLTIEVKNYALTYKVISVEIGECNVKEDMTVGQLNELQKRIVHESRIKEGGNIVLTYTNREQTLGSVTIHPTATGRPIVGTFKQDKKVTTEKVPYQEIKVTFADGQTIYWQILNYNLEENKPMLLIEDVTETYKSTYPQLEKATLSYKIIL